MSRKTVQEECDADGIVISPFAYFPTCFCFFYVLGNRDPRTSGLQSALETDEDVGTVLTAKDGTKWKQVQNSEQSTGRLAGHNILRQRPGPTSYTHRNMQAGSPASAWHNYWQAYTWTHTEVHRPWNFIAVTRAVTVWNDMPYHTSWTENWGVSLCKQAISRNHLSEILRFLCFDKGLIDLKVWKRKFCSFPGCVQEVYRELHFMLHTWGFHHCGWAASPRQMYISIYVAHGVKAW